MSLPNHMRKRHTMPVPAEGSDGLFTQSWFAICRSQDIQVGEVKGFGFLDGRIVVYRGENGEIRVMSAYCPHLGADLATGKVIGNDVQCGFHHWTFDQDGMCSGNQIGEVPPRLACLFNFPCREKYGVIWAFNGNEATWEIPSFSVPEEDLLIRVEYDNPVYPCDPWTICANTPDWQHLITNHEFEFDTDELYKQIKWTDNSMSYDLKGKMAEGPLDMHSEIHGTSIFMTAGLYGGMINYKMAAFGIPKPGFTQALFIMAVPKPDGSPGSVDHAEECLDRAYRISLRVTGDDRPIIHSWRYQPGFLTRVDRALAKYMELVRNYPRAHPSADFIR